MSARRRRAAGEADGGNSMSAGSAVARRRPRPPAPPRRRVPVHPDRQLRGPAAAARRVAAGEHLPGQQAAGRPGRGGRAVDAGAHVRPADGPGGGRPAGWRSAPATEVWFLRNAPDIAPRVEPAGQHDACFLPRSCHVTGDIGVHELAWAGDELWVVNTRFSCLCTLHPDYSFVPRWRPPFITALAAEDRCHLNGLAIVDGRPRYVTALGETDTAGGWRADKPQGGCLMDVPQRRGHQPRPVDAALAALARRPAVAAGIRDRAARARRSRHRPAADRGRAARLRPRPGAVRAVRLRRPVEDPQDVRDGRRAAGRAARAVEVRRGGGGPAQRPVSSPCWSSRPRWRRSSTCNSCPACASPR